MYVPVFVERWGAFGVYRVALYIGRLDWARLELGYGCGCGLDFDCLRLWLWL